MYVNRKFNIVSLETKSGNFSDLILTKILQIRIYINQPFFFLETKNTNINYFPVESKPF